MRPPILHAPRWLDCSSTHSFIFLFVWMNNHSSTRTLIKWENVSNFNQNCMWPGEFLNKWENIYCYFIKAKVKVCLKRNFSWHFLAHANIRPLIHPSFVHSSVRPSIHSSIESFLLLFVHPSIHAFLRLTTHSSIRTFNFFFLREKVLKRVAKIACDERNSSTNGYKVIAKYALRVYFELNKQ